MSDDISAFSVYKTTGANNEVINRKRNKKKQLLGGVTKNKKNAVHKSIKHKKILAKQVKTAVMNGDGIHSENSKIGVPGSKKKHKKNVPMLKKEREMIVVENKMPVDAIASESDASDEGFEPILLDSVEEGKKLLEWLIDPCDVDDFFQDVWEKKPLHITRKTSKYYRNIISSPAIDNMLRNDNLEFTKNIDITSYTDGKRETHNPIGRALPHIVWDFYLNGCSVRLLNPQTYIKRLHLLNATLQEYFNCFVGANAYLTPPDSQGFAPHYDDIEAFILQIEGKKKWRVYPPRSAEEALPRVSSQNFDQSEIGEPMLETILEPGDLLYFPRGFIHQAVTVEGCHSLHITLSCYQKHSWADLFEKMMTAGLQSAIEKEVDLRRGLPLDIYDHLGLVNSDSNTPRRNEILKQVKHLFGKILANLPIDDAVDQMNTNFMHDALPPVVDDPEKQCTVFGDSDVMTKNGVVINRVELSLDTKIRLLRAKILRMVAENESIRLYYYLENSKEYHGNELQYLEIEEAMAPAVETLIRTYPEYVSIEQLEIESDIDKMQLASGLWEKGLIIAEYPLPTIEN